MKLNFNEEGCLTPGIHLLSLSDVEDVFCLDKSQKRKEIFENYKIHLSEIKKTGCCINHWIDGSFVTLKENPNDIDTLTEFDGPKMDKLRLKDKIEDIIYNAPLRSNGCCHSLMIVKYPENFGELYEEYLYYKSNILIMLFCVNKLTKNPKGFIKLKGGN